MTMKCHTQKASVLILAVALDLLMVYVRGTEGGSVGGWGVGGQRGRGWGGGGGREHVPKARSSVHQTTSGET